MNKVDRMDVQIIGDIWTSNECYKNLQVLCDEIGARFCGTQGEKRARDFILGNLKEYGLDKVYLEEFEYVSWQRKEARLRIIEPVRKEIKTFSLGHVPSTSPQGITGEIVFVSSETSRDFERHKSRIRDKIVLITSGSPVSLSGKAPEEVPIKICRAAQLHAKAVLIASKTGGAKGSYNVAKIPAASISKEDAAYLIRLLDKYQMVKVNLYLKNSMKNRTSWNVIGEIAGNDKPDEEIIIAAHYDCWDTTPGAADNASGTAAVMELARVFSKHKSKLKRTVKFICFSAEEIGHRGSSAYVKRHAKELEKTILMLNIDPAIDTNYLVGGFSNLLQYLSELSRKSGFQNRAERYIGYNPDYFPFVLEGVSAVWMGTKDRRGWIKDTNYYRFGHTSLDTLEKVDIFDLKEALTVVAYTLLNIANVDKRPESHKNQNEVRKWLEKDASLVNTLKAGELWPFK